VLQSLGTETTKPSSAASCVAGIASAELPLQLWPELMGQLCDVLTTEGSSDTLKEASLESIGYICQDLVGFYCIIYICIYTNCQLFFVYKNYKNRKNTILL